ncbi:unnamed protein product, partial [marine sediment metagenome]
HSYALMSAETVAMPSKILIEAPAGKVAFPAGKTMSQS